MPAHAPALPRSSAARRHQLRAGGSQTARVARRLGGAPLARGAALLQSTTLAALGQNGIGTLGGPLHATQLGVHTWDDLLDDLSPPAHARLIEVLRGLHAEAQALPEGALAGEELL